MSYDDIEARLEREQFERIDRVRSLLLDKGRPDLAIELDRKLRDIDFGIYGAKSAWHSISAAQRNALLNLADGPSNNPSPRELKTLRCLIRRGLADPDGGAFNPECRIVISDRGRFVLKHGR